MTPNKSLRSLSLLSVTLLVAILGSGTLTPAPAANCDAIPCNCGDTLTASKTLGPGDPVTTTICPVDGLLVGADDVVLNLGGRTITGSGVGSGITILPGFGNVTVTSGTVRAFETGVLAPSTFGTLGTPTLTTLQLIENGTGIDVTGNHLTVVTCVVRYGTVDGIVVHGDAVEPDNDENLVKSNRAENNGGHGLSVTGRKSSILQNVALGNGLDGIVVNRDAVDPDNGENLVQSNRSERNDGLGLVVTGRKNSILQNVVLRNVLDGFEITGDFATASQNQSNYNGGEGFNVAGTNHRFTRNIALDNGADGYTVTAEQSHFERNTSRYNHGYGILDTTTDSGTAGTANTYVSNLCSGNTSGKSSPVGLCQ